MKIVVLTGAGISAESGLATFRDSGGLWANFRIEDVATPEAFATNPALVYQFYNLRRDELKNDQIQSNAAHVALAKLAQKHDVLVVTQNVDNLHERAGTTNLIHMHGELHKVRCLNCNHIHYWVDDLDQTHRCDSCSAGQLRPHIVWFGEMPLQMERIEAELSTADLFMSIGTSGNVYPAAGFVRLAKSAGAQTIELNMEPSQGASFFDEAIYGPASQIVPAYVEELLK